MMQPSGLHPLVYWQDLLTMAESVQYHLQIRRNMTGGSDWVYQFSPCIKGVEMLPHSTSSLAEALAFLAGVVEGQKMGALK